MTGVQTCALPISDHASGHNELADVLISREVIFTEDVERIFGKRQWTSRTDEILAARSADAAKAERKQADENRNIEDVDAEDIDVSASEDNAAADVNKEATPPPFKQENREE